MRCERFEVGEIEALEPNLAYGISPWGKEKST